MLERFEDMQREIRSREYTNDIQYNGYKSLRMTYNTMANRVYE